MKILFDYQIFHMHRYGGISRYFSRLAEELGELGQDPVILAPFHKNQYIQETPPCQIVGLGMDHFPPKTGRFFKATNELFSRFILSYLKPDLIHETYYSRARLGGRNLPRVITVYDMVHELFPDKFAVGDRTTALKRLSLARADHIISISHSTRRDLCRLFEIPEEKVTVVHLAYDEVGREGASRRQHSGQPFLLYVGSRGGYKNFLGFLRAVGGNSRLIGEFDIVAFGGGPFTAGEQEEIARIGFKAGAVRQVSGGDNVLADLYANAAAFVYPSLYEGFGLPPLEAMSLGCPVVSSNTSSMPEVIGRAAEFFDPGSMEDMALAMENVVMCEDRSRELRALGAERISHFSWRKCAQETLDVYRQVCAIKGGEFK